MTGQPGPHPDLADLRPVIDPATEAALLASYERIRTAAGRLPTRELIEFGDRELADLAGIYPPTTTRRTRHHDQGPEPLPGTPHHRHERWMRGQEAYDAVANILLTRLWDADPATGRAPRKARA